MAVWLKVVAVLLGLSGLAAVGMTVGVLPKPSMPVTVAMPVKVEPPVPVESAAPKAVESAPVSAPAPAPAPEAKVASLEPAPAPAARAAVADPQPPTFDIVRVLPTGEVVVAGRAAPDANVELLRNGRRHYQTKADGSGLFAMVPPNLPAGTHDLSLLMTLADGRSIASLQSVAISVPADSAGQVVVALASPDKPTEILSQPRPEAAKAAAAPGERIAAVLTSVEAEDGGRFYASGQSAPGASVRLYLNDTFLATAQAGSDGRWSFTINKGFEPGSYRVRVDDVDLHTGKVLSRAEVPFDYAPKVATRASGTKVAIATGQASGSPPSGGRSAGPQVASADAGGAGVANVVVDEIRTTAVTRGDSLWRISKRIYGNGLRYTVIYEANQKQIRDPRLIYPGQMFVVPGQGNP